MSKFDIIICVGPYDSNIIENMIPYTKKNVIGYRNIYLVCADPTINIDGTITIDEKIFPFNIDDLIAKFGNNNRNGWYLQQLLKLYSGNVIPGLLPNYLIIDSDTFFLKPVSFMDNNSKYIYTIGDEYHIPYFEHMKLLNTNFIKSYSKSGICHHMMMETKYIKELFNIIFKFPPSLSTLSSLLVFKSSLTSISSSRTKISSIIFSNIIAPMSLDKPILY